MEPPTLTIIAAGVAGGALGWLTTPFLLSRSARQPVDVDVATERALLQQLHDHPTCRPLLDDLVTADQFTHPERQQAYTDGQPDPTGDGDTAVLERVRTQAERRLAWHRSRPVSLARTVSPLLSGAAVLLLAVSIGVATAWALSTAPGGGPTIGSVLAGAALGAATLTFARRRHEPDRLDPHQTTVEELVTYQLGGTVAALADDRATLTAAADPEVTGDPDRPLRRPVLPATMRRRAAAATAAAAAGALLPPLAAQVPAATWAALLTVAALLWLSFHVATVDAYTYLLDYRAFPLPAPALAVGLVGVAVTYQADLAGGVAAAGIATVSVVLVVGIARALMLRRRGTPGWGGGDTKFLPFVVTIPAFLATEPQLGMYVLLLAGVLGLPIAVIRATRHQRGAPDPGGFGATPLPLLPFLAAAWPLAWLLSPTFQQFHP